MSTRQVALPPTLAPRLIGREAAAAYVNLGLTTFDEMVKAGKMPRPKQLTGKRRDWPTILMPSSYGPRRPRIEPKPFSSPNREWSCALHG
jgi:predicted DNA-binding transcriptional regulator AlpA